MSTAPDTAACAGLDRGHYYVRRDGVWTCIACGGTK